MASPSLPPFPGSLCVFETIDPSIRSIASCYIIQCTMKDSQYPLIKVNITSHFDDISAMVTSCVTDPPRL